MKKFDHKKSEKKWNEKWEEKGLYSPSDMKKAKNTFYNLWMFPYPSAEGLHAGHAFASTGSDVYGRYKRMTGHMVFQPIGYDSFGIHSENFALKISEHPKKMLARTTKRYEKQMKMLGHGYDWTRTVTTSEVDYYRWTQWLFVQMFKSGLAYRKKSPVNWCPSCKTVLADEQVVTPKQAGKLPPGYDSYDEVPEDTLVCERCGHIAEIKNLEQWFFRITDYADRLLKNLSKIDWPEKIKTAQRNWIGKKEGIDIKYKIKDTNSTITCWTSRPDTNFGATFIVVSPEYAKDNLVQFVGNNYKNDLEKYIKRSLKKSKKDRTEQAREKTGVFTGLFAVNNLNNYELPIWVSDFVLPDVGTGAVVGVPGHDMRDFEFAKKFDLPIKRVVVASDADTSKITKKEQVQENEGKMVNSEFLNGMDIQKAISKMIKHLEKKGWGEKTVNYHLRDWLISRQRYWGPPIPMIFCEKCASQDKSWFTTQNAFRALHKDQSDWEHAGWWPEENLPVELPHLTDYKPKGEGSGPLDDHPEFYKTTCPNCGSEAKRETDVSDTFLDSAWYFLAYPMQGQKEWQEGPSKMGKKVIDNQITKTWLPVDLYFGGAEHAVLHLMYARFVTMLLKDLEYVEFEEPFPSFFAHGLMIKDGSKMSKSKGNVVNPDKYIKKYGADTLRLYTMFMGPMDGYPDFRDTGIEGMRRFVDRVWDLFAGDFKQISQKDLKSLEVKKHKTIKKVTEDIKVFSYNTAISAIMEYVNALREHLVLENGEEKSSKDETRNHLETLTLLMAPFAPFLAEEVWNEKLGKKFSVHIQKWPQYEEKMTKEVVVEIPVQINGKLRNTIKIDREEAQNKEKVLDLAQKDAKIQKYIKEKKIKKEIFVPGKLLNLVIG